MAKTFLQLDPEEIWPHQPRASSPHFGIITGVRIGLIVSILLSRRDDFWKLGPSANFLGAVAFGACGTIYYIFALRRDPSARSRA